MRKQDFDNLAESTLTVGLSTHLRFIMDTNTFSSAESPLGERLEVFKPMAANLVAGFVLSFLLIAAGLVILGLIAREVYLSGGDLPFDARKGMSWLAAGLGSMIGLGLSVGGAFLTRYVRGLLSRQIEMCANGFRYRTGRAAEEVLWSEVASIREIILFQRPPILKGPAKLILPEVASTSYTVLTKAGKEYGFDGDSIRKIKRFGKLLREQAGRLGVSWESVEQHG